MDKRPLHSPAGAFVAPDPAELSALLPGYEVSALIGSGGMGAVYLARQKTLDRDAAIKILPREFGADPEFRANFESEAKAMARLNDPNLIRVYDFGEVDDFLFIIMESVDGKSLYRSAHGKAIEQKEVARLVHGICNGLAHAHELGIIHRDIRPANILLDSKKRPKIGDFGLARPIDSTGRAAPAAAPTDYTAPEVLEDPASASKRSDVYSTGVLLYELLTGELPGGNFVPPSQLQEVDPGFDKITRRAMHPAPGMRFADAEEMAKEIGALRESLDKPGARTKSGGRPARLVSAGDADPDTAVTPLASADAAAHHQRIVARNLVIIAILLLAILMIFVAYNRRKSDTERKQEVADKELPELGDPTGYKVSRPSPAAPPRAPVRDPREPATPPSATGPEDLALGELQKSLARGDRLRFPRGTQALGEDRVFLVRTPMSWQSAASFAEAHGGHLATLRDDAAKAQLSAMIPPGATVWLGGGTTGGAGWGWIDGSSWALTTQPPAPTGNYVTMDAKGTIHARPGPDDHPFFIQWHMNGENPGSLDAQLKRAKESLAGAKPVYPPGTLSHQGRHYLILNKAVRWGEARDFARRAGGHLAVPGEEAENAYLRDAVGLLVPDRGTAWIGGHYESRAWTWTTGETWTWSAWVPVPEDGLDPNGTAVCIVPGPAGGWDNVDPNRENTTGALVIEWSADYRAQREPSPPATTAAWMELRKRATVRVYKDRAELERKIAQNGRDLNAALEKWYNGLPPRIKGRHFNSVQKAREVIIPGGRIDETKLRTLPRIHQDIGAVCNAHLQIQRTVDANYKATLDKLRGDYVAQMETMRVAAQSARLIDEAEDIAEEIAASGIDGESFLDHLKTGL